MYLLVIMNSKRSVTLDPPSFSDYPCFNLFRIFIVDGLFSAVVSVATSDDGPAETDEEPVEELKGRHKADAETESKKSAEVGDEVKDCHLTGPLILLKTIIHQKLSLQPHQKRLTLRRKC